MMGWTDFSSLSATNFITFDATFSNLSTIPVGSNDTYGITMQPPIPFNYPTNQPMDVIGFSLFYVKSLICTNSTYIYDNSTGLCTECSII